MNLTPKRRRDLSRAAGGMVLLAVAAGPWPGAARADELDVKLNEAMPAVVAQLKKKGHKNVGVLRFYVKQPGKQAGYNTPMSGSLATRVENLLVIHGGPTEQATLGVIHDASKVARLAKVSGWPTAAAERRKLFALDYPLAWGKATVKPDVFLTGQVELSKDLRTTTLRLQAFDRKSDKPTVVKTVIIDTDRQVVRDLGYSFELTSKTRSVLLGRPPTAREVDRFILELLGAKGEPGQVGGVAVELLVAGKPRPFRRATSADDPIAWQVASPRAGEAVAFRLKNTSAHKRAVVLRLNGVSVINELRAEPERAGKIILDPKEQRVIKGFLMFTPDKDRVGPDARLRAFKIAVGDEARQARQELGDKAGLIEVDVFEEGRGEAPPSITLRGVPASKDAHARKDFATLRRALLASARLTAHTAGTRELIVPDAAAQPSPSPDPLAVVTFDRPQLIGRIAVKVK